MSASNNRVRGGNNHVPRAAANYDHQLGGLYPWRHLPSYFHGVSRFAAEHIRTVREESAWCDCLICCEARRTWMVIPFGISTRFQEYEKLTGAMIYWTPHLVWACHNCAHRWLAEGLKYPEKCPKCNSEHWDERKDYAEPGRRHRIAK